MVTGCGCGPPVLWGALPGVHVVADACRPHGSTGWLPLLLPLSEQSGQCRTEMLLGWREGACGGLKIAVSCLRLWSLCACAAGLVHPACLPATPPPLPRPRPPPSRRPLLLQLQRPPCHLVPGGGAVAAQLQQSSPPPAPPPPPRRTTQHIRNTPRLRGPLPPPPPPPPHARVLVI